MRLELDAQEAIQAFEKVKTFEESPTGEADDKESMVMILRRRRIVLISGPLPSRLRTCWRRQRDGQRVRRRARQRRGRAACWVDGGGLPENHRPPRRPALTP